MKTKLRLFIKNMKNDKYAVDWVLNKDIKNFYYERYLYNWDLFWSLLNTINKTYITDIKSNYHRSFIMKNINNLLSTSRNKKFRSRDFWLSLRSIRNKFQPRFDQFKFQLNFDSHDFPKFFSKLLIIITL